MEAIATGSKILSGVAALFANFMAPGDPMLNEFSAINRDWNSFARVTDTVNYGVEQYWATPKEVREKGSGDDEDLAIGKMFDLVGRGYPESKMKLAAVRRKDDKTNHVVLLVDYKEKTYVLDSDKESIYVRPPASDMVVVYRLNRESFLFDDLTLLKEDPSGLGNFRRVLTKMKDDGSLKGDVFPALAPIGVPTGMKNATAVKPPQG